MARCPLILSICVCVIALTATGCSLFGSGNRLDARLFIARVGTQFLEVDRDFPVDPHTLEGYLLVDVGHLSPPVLLGTGFNSRGELDVMLYQEDDRVPYVLRFRRDGRSLSERRLSDAFVIDTVTDVARAIVLPDDSLLFVGRDGEFVRTADFLLMNASQLGEPVPTFGTNGRVLTDFPSITVGGEIARAEFARDAAVSGTGRLYVAGTRSWEELTLERSDIAVARYDPTGNLDASFSGDGKQITAPLNGRMTSPERIALDDAGRLLIGAHSVFRDGTRWFVITRLRNNGSVDTTFGTNGWISIRQFFDESLVRITPLSGVTLVATSRRLFAFRDDGAPYDGFGEPMAGTPARTGSRSMPGSILDHVFMNGQHYVLTVGLEPTESLPREETTLYELTGAGDTRREEAIGFRPGIMPEAEFVGQRLVVDGASLYVVGFVQ